MSIFSRTRDLTPAEARLKRAMSGMPFSGYARLSALAADMGDTASIELDDVSTWLEGLSAILEEHVAELEKDKKRVAKLEADVAAIRRVGEILGVPGGSEVLLAAVQKVLAEAELATAGGSS